MLKSVPLTMLSFVLLVLSSYLPLISPCLFVIGCTCRMLGGPEGILRANSRIGTTAST